MPQVGDVGVAKQAEFAKEDKNPGSFARDEANGFSKNDVKNLGRFVRDEASDFSKDDVKNPGRFQKRKDRIILPDNEE